MTDFFKGLTTEFSHITWPSKKEALLVTALVLVISFAVGYYLGGLDALFAWLLKLVIT